MKIVDAFWEKRNLGVSCKEIEIENCDTAEVVAEKLSGMEAEYTVVKTPIARTDIMELLNENGFNFIECMFHATHNLKMPEISSVQKRMAEAVDYRLMKEDETEELFSEIRKGMFVTDRIFLDSHFTDSQAAERYVNWIKDEIARGTELYLLTHKEKHVGFFIFKEISDEEFNPFLAGIYSNKSLPGIGIAIQYNVIKEAQKRNGKLLHAYFSTNNAPVMNAHLLFNYEIKAVNYVYVKHSKTV